MTEDAHFVAREKQQGAEATLASIFNKCFGAFSAQGCQEELNTCPPLRVAMRKVRALRGQPLCPLLSLTGWTSTAPPALCALWLGKGGLWLQRGFPFSLCYEFNVHRKCRSLHLEEE